ncbi:lamin tail domain-containing protein [Candidatus Bipolaricaulota bacterium]
MSRFLLVLLAAGLAAVLAALLLGSEDTHSLASSMSHPIEFATPFRYAPPADVTGEVVTLRNTGTDPIDMSGWTLRNERGEIYVFPAGFSLAPQGQVAIHSSCGEDSESDLYWCSRLPVWNDNGGVATLSTRDGEDVASYSYGGCTSCSM